MSAPRARSSSRGGAELLRRGRRRLDARLGRPDGRRERRRRDRPAADARGDRRLPGARRRGVHGHALGGGVGLVACSDIVLARANSVRVLRGEARDRPRRDLAVRAPQDRRERRAALVRDWRALRRRRRRSGSASCTSSPTTSTLRSTRVLAELRTAGPRAARHAKRLVLERPDGQETARRIAERRTSDEGQEGLRAFLERRPAAWAPPTDERLGPGGATGRRAAGSCAWSRSRRCAASCPCRRGPCAEVSARRRLRAGADRFPLVATSRWSTYGLAPLPGRTCPHTVVASP